MLESNAELEHLGTLVNDWSSIRVVCVYVWDSTSSCTRLQVSQKHSVIMCGILALVCARCPDDLLQCTVCPIHSFFEMFSFLLCIECHYLVRRVRASAVNNHGSNIQRLTCKMVMRLCIITLPFLKKSRALKQSLKAELKRAHFLLNSYFII